MADLVAAEGEGRGLARALTRPGCACAPTRPSASRCARRRPASSVSISQPPRMDRHDGCGRLGQCLPIVRCDPACPGVPGATPLGDLARPVRVEVAVLRRPAEPPPHAARAPAPAAHGALEGRRRACPPQRCARAGLEVTSARLLPRAPCPPAMQSFDDRVDTSSVPGAVARGGGVAGMASSGNGRRALHRDPLARPGGRLRDLCRAAGLVRRASPGRRCPPRGSPRWSRGVRALG